MPNRTHFTASYRGLLGGSHLKSLFAVALTLSAIASSPGVAKVVNVTGDMRTAVTTTDRRNIHIPGGVERFRLLLPVYSSFTAGPNQQQVESCTTTFNVEPTSQRVLRDAFGNRYLEAIWNRPEAGTVTMETRAHVAMSLHAAPAHAVEYPLNINTIPAEARTYLRGTELVQTNDPGIRRLAEQILSRPDLTCEGDVVNAVVSWLVDHVQYGQDNGQYDAVSTLRTKSGVCTGYSHLALALLRSMGIPARFAAGLSFQHPYQIAGNHSTYSMDERSLSGFLYHAWIEVYFPGEGWVEYDPQGNFNFVDTRRIVFSVGLDKDSLPEGRYINTYAALNDPGAFSEDSSANVHVDSDLVRLTETGLGVRSPGPAKYGLFMARPID